MKRRIFIGTKIGFDVISNTYLKFRKEIENYCRGKWVEPENLHFTYWFLGDVEEEIIFNLKTELVGILNEYKSSLELKGVSAFPNMINPRVIFIKVRNEDNIIHSKYREMKKILQGLNLNTDEKVFSSHITLIRVKSSRPGLKKILENYFDNYFGKVDNFSIDLIESKLTQSGPIYTAL